MWAWLERLRLRFGGAITPSGTLAVPMAQHYEASERDKWKAEHGYSAAFDPMPWSEDIAKHNAEVTREYDEEVARRMAAYDAGEYQPKVMVLKSGQLTAARLEAIMQNHERPRAVELDWHMDMTAAPGRRRDVTHEQPAPLPPAEVLAAAREAGRLVHQIALEEYRQNRQREDRPAILDRLIGTRDQVLASCDGDADKADQVEETIAVAHLVAERMRQREEALKDTQPAL